MSTTNKPRVIQIEAKEIPEVVVALTSLSWSRQHALLQFIGLEVVQRTNYFQIDVEFWSGMKIKVYEQSPKQLAFEPLDLNEDAGNFSLTAILPADFCVFLTIQRKIAWESDAITLNDGSSAKFVGTGIGSLLGFMGRSLGVPSSMIQYLRDDPARLDEDLDVLRDDLTSERWDHVW